MARRAKIVLVRAQLEAMRLTYEAMRESCAWLAKFSPDHEERNFWEEGADSARLGIERIDMTCAFTRAYLDRYEERDAIALKAIS